MQARLAAQRQPLPTHLGEIDLPQAFPTFLKIAYAQHGDRPKMMHTHWHN